MVDWKGAGTEAADTMGMERIFLILNGLYFYELICYINFDWKLLTSQDDGQTCSIVAKCVKATYLCCRYCAFIAATIEVYMYFRSPRGPIPCWTLIKISTGTAALGGTCSSALIAVRAMVVWTWNARITTLGAIVFLGVLGTDIRISLSLSSSYDPITKSCTLNDEYSNMPNILALLVCDSVMLVCLLAGLYRWHRPRKGIRAFRLWSMLWGQGIMYLGLASATEIPTLVILVLNLNPLMNTIVMKPLVVILVIATTRFYRSLNAFTPNQTRDDFTNSIRFATVDVRSAMPPAMNGPE